MLFWIICTFKNISLILIALNTCEGQWNMALRIRYKVSVKDTKKTLTNTQTFKCLFTLLVMSILLLSSIIDTEEITSSLCMKSFTILKDQEQNMETDRICLSKRGLWKIIVHKHGLSLDLFGRQPSKRKIRFHDNYTIENFFLSSLSRDCQHDTVTFVTFGDFLSLGHLEKLVLR